MSESSAGNRMRQGFTTAVTLELGLDQRASICQGRKRGEDVQAEGTTKAKTWKTTGKGTHEVLSMPESEPGNGTRQLGSATSSKVSFVRRGDCPFF